jgi:hypothetical protein
MIKHRIKLVNFFLLLLSLGFAAAEANASFLCILGRLIACGPFLETFQIDDVSHHLFRVLNGLDSNAQWSGDVSTTGALPLRRPHHDVRCPEPSPRPAPDQ